MHQLQYPTTEDIVLIKKRVCAAVKVDEFNIRLGVNHVNDRVASELIYQLDMFLYAQELSKTIKFSTETYDSWIDHLIDTKFPVWLKRFFTINKTTHTEEHCVEFDVMFPEYVSPTDQPYVVVRRLKPI